MAQGQEHTRPGPDASTERGLLCDLAADLTAHAQATAAQIRRETMELTLRGKQAPTTPQGEPVGLFAQHQAELF